MAAREQVGLDSTNVIGQSITLVAKVTARPIGRALIRKSIDKSNVDDI